MATGDDVNTPVIALVGFISALMFFAIIILLEVIFYWTDSQQRYELVVSQPPQELAALTHNQQARLAEYRWVDEKKGVVAIPIDRAMELVVADLSAAAKPAPAKEGKR
jgi:nitrogen fixation protein FixH